MKEGWMKDVDFKLLRGFDLWWTDGQMNGQTNEQTDQQTDKRTNEQTNGQTNGQTNKRMDKQTDICECRVAFATENYTQHQLLTFHLA